MITPSDAPHAPSLRDRIAAAVHEEQSVDAVLEVLADADPTDIGGRTLSKIRMLEQERDFMQRRTFELSEQVAAARAELPEVLDLLRAVVERCVPAVLDVQDRPIDDLWGRVWHRLGTARPRTKETPDD